MDIVTRADLERLFARDETGPYVSLFMPTHRFGSGIQADRIRWKNNLTSVASALADAGLRRPDVEALLEPAWTLEADAMAWQYMSDGLAMFLRPGHAQTFRVPVGVPELAAVGDRFVVSPLLRVLSGDEHFLVLAVSQRDVRLLEGSRDHVEVVELPEVPTSLREVITAPEPRSDTMARPTFGGRGGPAIFYGHGAGDDHLKTEEMERFVRVVADGLGDYLAGQDLPLVLVGLDQLVAAYREVSRYPHVMADAVIRHPDELSADELHAAAWPVAAQRLRAEKERVLERFAELHGTGRASTEPSKIEEAAAQGRVETLFLPVEPTCWETSMPTQTSAAVVRLGTDEAFMHCELADRAALDTLVQGGQVYGAPGARMPGGGRIAAVLRY